MNEHNNKMLKKHNKNISSTVTNDKIKLIIDNRECSLIEKLSLKNSESIQIQQLPLGDIIIGESFENPLIIIERKTFNDLFASLKDGRYDEQTLRLRFSSNIHCHNIIYLLEGTISSLNDTKQKLLYSCINPIEIASADVDKTNSGSITRNFQKK